MLAAGLIRAGDGDVYMAGGMENMSLAPYLLPQARVGYRLGDGQLVDAVVHDGLWCAFTDKHMGNSAEFIAEQYALTRQELDEYAFHSHRKAVEAIDAGRFKARSCRWSCRSAKGRLSCLTRTSAPAAIRRWRRWPSSSRPSRMAASSLLAMRPVLPMGGGGGGYESGAGREAGRQAAGPHCRLRPGGSAPEWLFIAPAHAVRRLLKRTGTTLADYDLFEVNEAFAAQVVADGKELTRTAGLEQGQRQRRSHCPGPPDRLLWGAGVGNPHLCAQGPWLRRGMASLCLGGGEAVALAVETE